MKKNIFLLLCFACPISSMASDQPPMELKGVSIVSPSQMPLPNFIKEEGNLRIKQQKEKGYYETGEPVAKFLFNVDKSAEKELKMNFSDPTDTHMKTSISFLKLSVPFKGAKIPEKDVIGYAPMGGYEKKGWTGFKQFFKFNPIGNCAFSKAKVNGVTLSEDAIEYLVNKKPTHKNFAGNKENGFFYELTWFESKKDSVYMSSLECANKKFDESIVKQIIALANEIDKNQ